MEKLNPQPEPPIGEGLLDWFLYFFDLIAWFFSSLFDF